VPGSTGQVFVHVHNVGVETAHNVRVLALWAPHSQAPPPLPDSFWAQTFPAHATSCGPLPAGSKWQFLCTKTSSSSFSSLPEIAPDQSRVVTFAWDVPKLAGQFPSILAIVESDEDAIPEEVRKTPVVDCSILVPNHHQVALRALHHLSLPADSLAEFNVQNLTGPSRAPRLVFSAASIPAGAQLVLVPNLRARIEAHGFEQFKLDLGRLHGFALNAGSLDFARAQRLVGLSGTIDVLNSVPAGDMWPFAFALLRKNDLDAGKRPIPWRFTITAMRDSTVLGGNTYLVSGP
jgi:hypothetical protein